MRHAQVGLHTQPVCTLSAMAKDVMLMNSIGPSKSELYVANADGTGEHRLLTTFPANDANAVWSQDGKHIMWNSGEYDFKDEGALYDNSFQPYGSIWIMKADGTEKRQLTDSHWEYAMPCFVPKTGAKATSQNRTQDRQAPGGR